MISIIRCILFLLYIAASYENVLKLCPLSTQCSCYSTGTSYDCLQIKCPKKNPTFTVDYTGVRTEARSTWIEINCMNSMKLEDYKMIPEIPVEFVPLILEIKFYGCPFPEDSLTTVINRFGIKKAKTELIFNKSRNDINRHHFEGLKTVTKLVLSDTGLTVLPADVFYNLIKLKELTLSDNNFSTLPAGLFRNLKVLDHLYLNNNNLTSLTSEMFKDLIRLKVLDLSFNNFQTLSSDIFHFLPSLETLNMNSNNFTELPEGLFLKNPNLKFLRLCDNKQNLKRLPNKMLSNLRNLNEIYLCRNNIENFGELFLVRSINITSISLESNMLQNISVNFFIDQLNLMDLNLSNNQLRKIPQNIFLSLKKLEVLNLDNNKITKIPNACFNDLLALKKLYIRHNLLCNIPNDIFENCRNLQYIDLSFNNLHDGSITSFKELHHLQYLNISHNLLPSVFSKPNSNELTQLDLSYNNISKISFFDIPMVINVSTHIYLHNNNIYEIDFSNRTKAGIYHYLYPRVKRRLYDVDDIRFEFFENNIEDPIRPVKLHIESIRILCDCKSFHFIKYLRGELQDIDEVNTLINVNTESTTCKGPKHFEGLELRDVIPQEIICPLDECPSDCKCSVRPNDDHLIVYCPVPRSEKHLSLPDIRDISNAFRTDVKYIELHYENQMIENISQLSIEPNKFNQITKLYLPRNKISHLSIEDIPKNVSVIDLRYNNIGRVNTTNSYFFSNLTSVSEIWLSNNPLECDCENKLFLSILQSNTDKIKDYFNVSCSDNQLVRKINTDVLCDIDPVALAISVSVPLTGFIVGFLAILYYIYKEEIKVWLYSKKFCLLCITEEDLDKDKLFDAFISYSHKDEKFVIETLVAQLEEGPRPFKICIHVRDWLAGQFIPTQIINSVEHSRRTLIVLSPDFIKSEWAKLEFQTAHRQALTEGRARVILIVYGDIGPEVHLDNELRTYLTMNTYIKWGDPWFWEKLRYAMPHNKKSETINPARSIRNRTGFDDRIELNDLTRC